MTNRERKQTGPRTNAGKAISSRNSTKHGLRSDPVRLLPGETEADYEAARNQWLAAYDPSQPGIQPLLDDVVNNHRLLTLANRRVMEAEWSLLANPLDPAARKDLELFHRYKTTYDRAFQRSLRNLEQFAHRRTQEEIARRRIRAFELQLTHNIAVSCLKHNIPPPEGVILDELRPDPVSPDQPPPQDSPGAAPALLQPSHEQPSRPPVSGSETSWETEEDYPPGTVG